MSYKEARDLKDRQHKLYNERIKKVQNGELPNTKLEVQSQFKSLSNKDSSFKINLE